MERIQFLAFINIAPVWSVFILSYIIQMKKKRHFNNVIRKHNSKCL